MIAILFIAFFALLFINIPIAFVLILSTVSYALMIGGIDWMLVPGRIVFGVNNFVMLCLPFFMLAGNIMSTGGITEKLIKMAQSYMGHVRGGLAMCDVLVCMMFGTVSGSAVAGTSAVGSLMIPSMKKEGYDAGFAAGLTSVASTCCPVIPPSLAFVIYGAAAKVSVGDMFIAGIVPGILMAGLMMALAYYFSVKRNYPRQERSNWHERLITTVKALPCLGIPVIIIAGITLGWFTPTEASAIAVVYAVLLAGLFYRTLTWKSLWKAIINAAIDSGTVMLIVGGCYLFGWVLANEQITKSLTEGLVAMDVSLTLKLLLINITLLIVGMFMDSAPAILLVAPILAPAMEGMGMDPIQVGMIVCVNLVIGLSTPPVGVCLYAAANIGRVKFGEVARNAWPFVIATIVALMMITYIPFITQIPFIILGR